MNTSIVDTTFYSRPKLPKQCNPPFHKLGIMFQVKDWVFILSPSLCVNGHNVNRLLIDTSGKLQYRAFLGPSNSEYF